MLILNHLHKTLSPLNATFTKNRGVSLLWLTRPHFLTAFRRSAGATYGLSSLGTVLPGEQDLLPPKFRAL